MWNFLKAINRRLERVLLGVLAIAFGTLIAVVFAQVFARNVLAIPLIWTLDVAQLLFAWCIFLGAAVALRWNAHYSLELVPAAWARTNSAMVLIAHVGSVVVIAVLIVSGWAFAQIGLNRLSLALGISEFWFFLPIPLGGAAMALFLAELIPADLRQAAATWHTAPR
ncbi:MAG: TRAP transporter small permease subunit [Gammaproteobacteria bacterium]|nr:TRAP transporter small permease subunit [Gammaproteobacteria bacterium]